MTWIIGASVALLVLVSLFVFPRQIGILILVAASVAATIYLYLQQQQANRERGIETITATAQIDTAACSDPDYPIAVNFHNASQRMASYIAFSLQATRPGLAQYTSRTATDQTIGPGEDYTGCWPVPPPRPRNFNPYIMNWSIDIRQVDFGG